MCDSVSDVGLKDVLQGGIWICIETPTYYFPQYGLLKVAVGIWKVIRAQESEDNQSAQVPVLHETN